MTLPFIIQKTINYESRHDNVGVCDYNSIFYQKNVVRLISTHGKQNKLEFYTNLEIKTCIKYFLLVLTFN